MSTVIRRAMANDASAVAAIVREAFEEAPAPDTLHVARALSHGCNYVACRGDQVVGFVGNFLTDSAAGKRRFELDLLAVAEEARGIGVGTALVKATVDAAQRTDADLIRALVGSGNIVMRGICLACGFRRDKTGYALYVLALPTSAAMAETIPDPLPSDAHLVPVETLTYSGVWLEGSLTNAAFIAARERAARESREILGTVVPLSDDGARDRLAANGFEFVGAFDWWTISLQSGRS